VNRLPERTTRIQRQVVAWNTERCVVRLSKLITWLPNARDALLSGHLGGSSKLGIHTSIDVDGLDDTPLQKPEILVCLECGCEIVVVG